MSIGLFVENTLEYLRVHFQNFVIDGSMLKLMSNSDFYVTGATLFAFHLVVLL